MIRRSLRLRLALAGALAICLALAAAGAALTLLFERHVYRTLSDDLDADLRLLIGGLDVEADGKVVVARPPLNPRFEEPLSGLYWQVATARGLLRSRSLWDAALTPPPDLPSEGQTHYHQAPGPGGKLLLIAERRILIATPQGRAEIRVIVGSDLTRLRRARDAFVADLAWSLLALAIFLGVGTWLQLDLGLRPLGRLRREIADIAEGRLAQLSDQAPEEVLPLVGAINGLIDVQEGALARARGRAADLAHGLKTPLAALAADARRLRRSGDVETANSLDLVGETMRRHVERELARARVGAAAMRRGGYRTPLKPVVDGLIRTLLRTEKGEKIAFTSEIDAEAALSFEPLDLTELLGNLLENATRHAVGRVAVGWRPESGGPFISIEDDGPGLDPAQEALARQRGVRLDLGGGAGLGLAITQDILDAYGWKMDFSRSALGGLAVLLSPAEAPPTGLIG